MIAFLLKAVLISLDFSITLVTFGWLGIIKKKLEGKKLRTVPVGDVPSHRIHPDAKEKKFASIEEGVTSMYEIIDKCCKKFSTRNALASREYIGNEGPKIKVFGPNIQYETYDGLRTKFLKFGAALRSVGLVAAPKACSLDKFDTPRSVAIFENTCAEWITSCLGAFSQSVVVTTIYATLGMDAVVDSINDGVISVLVCNQVNVDAVLSRISEMPTLKTIVYTQHMILPEDKSFKPKSVPAGLTVVSFEEFLEMGDTAKYPPTPPAGESCAVVMYTSGSTGKPKGVLISHANISAALAGILASLGIKEGDVYLGYLPLAHILELCSELGLLSMGCTVCYADPKTLTTSGAKPIGALEQFSPTLMAGVPKIWDVIKKGAQAKINGGPKVAKIIAEAAFQAKSFALKQGYDTPLFNALVFKKFKKLVGGKLRFALSGGGPLHEDIQDFIRTAFGMPLIQGYGLTETCAALTIQDQKDLRPAIAGVPAPCCEVKLISCPDIHDKAGLAYLSTDTVDNVGTPIFGRGEVLVKGLNIAFGYYMMPDKTKEEFDSDGFFHTGDIAQFMTDGSLRIVDRKKNLVKLKGGEYIALESMEGVYGNSPFVDPVLGGLVCYGDGDMDRPIVILQLNHAYIKAWGKENGFDGENIEKIIASKELYDAVLKDLRGEAARGGLSHLEKIVAIAYATTPWTPENNCLTAANKLNRKVILQVEEKEFEIARKKGIF